MVRGVGGVVVVWCSSGHRGCPHCRLGGGEGQGRGGVVGGVGGVVGLKRLIHGVNPLKRTSPRLPLTSHNLQHSAACHVLQAAPVAQ